MDDVAKAIQTLINAGYRMEGQSRAGVRALVFYAPDAPPTSNAPALGGRRAHDSED